MKKRSLTIFVLAVLLIVGIIVYHSKNTLYGNDKESIVKVIKSIEGYEDKTVEILGIRDFGDVRAVGFLSNGYPAYIEFHKNKSGNYKWESIEAKSDETLSSFFITPLNNTGPKFMFVSNHQNKIAKMQVDVNGQKIEQHFPLNKATVTWVDLPKTDSKEYTFKHYQFFDAEGNLIEAMSN